MHSLPPSFTHAHGFSMTPPRSASLGSSSSVVSTPTSSPTALSRRLSQPENDLSQLLDIAYLCKTNMHSAVGHYEEYRKSKTTPIIKNANSSTRL